jgi:hypothetical protein
MSNFEGAWKNLAEHDNGYDFDLGPEEDNSHIHGSSSEIIKSIAERNISSLLEIEESSRRDEIMKELFADFLKGLLRYIFTIDSLSLARINGKESRKVMGEADKNRRIAHEAWISDVNALSRYFVKLGIDNSWRNVLGSTRDEQTGWALSVAKTARDIALKGGK